MADFEFQTSSGPHGSSVFLATKHSTKILLADGKTHYEAFEEALQVLEQLREGVQKKLYTVKALAQMIIKMPTEERRREFRELEERDRLMAMLVSNYISKLSKEVGGGDD